MNGQKLRAKPNTADMIMYNGKIITVDREFSIVQAVAIKGNTIVAVGKDHDMDPFKGAQTKMVNLRGKTVVPGLIDSHIHGSMCAQEINNFNLNKVRSINDLLQAVEQCVSSTKQGQLVISSSAWHESQLSEERLPTRWELDKVSPNHPVILPRGGHVVVVNSKALELVGFTKDTPDPDHGLIVKDPDTNEPTGVLIENAAAIVKDLVPRLTREQLKQGVIDFMKEMNASGVTGMIDPWATDNEISVYSELSEQNKMTVRTQALYAVMSLQETLDAVSKYKPRQGNDYFCVSGIKTLADGGVEGAWMKQPHQIVIGEQPNPEYCGVQVYAGAREKEFADMLKVVVEKGFQMQVHAAGDAANEFVVNSYEEVNKTMSIQDLRWVVMHVMYPTEESLNKIKELGILTTVQDHPYLLGRNMKRYWGGQRTNSAIPLRTMLGKGIIMGGGTDAPVVPWNPFISISWMVTRRTVNRDVQGPDETISRKDALYLWTMGSAYIQGNENKLGSIEPGKLADLVVLSENLLTVPAEKIESIEAHTTIVGGKIVYQAK